MKHGSKEFSELQAQFEKDVKDMPIYIGAKIERDTNEHGHYYNNSTVNALFIGYMHGYQSAKSLARIGALELSE